MTIRYRTTGDWGSGLGSNLSPAQVDENFYTLAQQIAALVENPVQPVSIAEITVDGRNMSIHLTNATVLGPFTLPVATFRWREAWAPDTLYEELDWFYVPGDAVYAVLVDHTSASDFDPNAEETEETPLYRRMFPLGIISQDIFTFPGDAAVTMLAGYHGGLVRIGDPDGTADFSVSAVFPPALQEVGTEIRIRQIGDQPILFEAGAESAGATVVLVGRAGYNLQTILRGDTVWAKLVSVEDGTDGPLITWELWGDLASDLS